MRVMTGRPIISSKVWQMEDRGMLSRQPMDLPDLPAAEGWYSKVGCFKKPLSLGRPLFLRVIERQDEDRSDNSSSSSRAFS